MVLLQGYKDSASWKAEMDLNKIKYYLNLSEPNISQTTWHRGYSAFTTWLTRVTKSLWRHQPSSWRPSASGPSARNAKIAKLFSRKPQCTATQQLHATES